MPEKQLTARSIIFGLVGMLLITSSSMFLALKIGTMPWPMLFATILSMTILGRFKGSSNQEISITETIMASGAMVAGGIVFTIPGIWMLNPDAKIPFLPIAVMSVCGVLLGILFSALYRSRLIVEQQLVFPHGNAVFETISTGIKKGKDSLKLIISMGFSALFAAVRDILQLFPARLTLFAGNSLVQPVSLWLSPMALSIGAMISRLSAFVWLGGTLFAYLVFTPIAMKAGWFSDFTAVNDFRQNIGIGIVIGTGVGVFIKAIFDIVVKKLAKKEEKKSEKTASEGSGNKTKNIGLILGVSVGCVILLTAGTELSFAQALLAVAGAGLTTLLSGMLTGECGTNPLEVFGILVMLASSMLLKTSGTALFLTAGTVSVACGLTGVMMNDFKSGYKLGTDSKQQLLAETIGALAGALLSTAMLFVIKKSIGTFGTDSYPAPQAAAVASLVKGGQNNPELLWAILAGAILYLLKVPSATLGLGIYMPIHISISMGFGAIAAVIMDKTGKVQDKDINLISSGFMGGEGVVGVIVAIISIFS